MTAQFEETTAEERMEAFAANYALGREALEELRVLKPVLALAISKLPKKQLKLSLTDQAKLDELEVQFKQEEKSGALVFRAVKA